MNSGVQLSSVDTRTSFLTSNLPVVTTTNRDSAVIQGVKTVGCPFVEGVCAVRPYTCADSPMYTSPCMSLIGIGSLSYAAMLDRNA